MNACDLVITVALGSTLAAVLLSREVALADGILAIFLLVALQFIVTWLSLRSSKIRELARSEPTILLYQGEFLLPAMRKQSVPNRRSIRRRGLRA